MSHPSLEVTIFRIQAKSVTVRRGYLVKMYSLEDVSEEYILSIFWVKEKYVKTYPDLGYKGAYRKLWRGVEKRCFMSTEATREKQRLAGEK